MECNTAALLLYTILVITEEFQVTLGYLINNSTDACLTEYFYNDFQPVYMNTTTESEILICQTWDEQRHFITRYSTQYKIPIYSAYRIDSFKKASECVERSREQWRNESSDGNSNPIKQAKDDDYTKSEFYRGHLNPRCHNQNSKDNVRATYTLTNAVPMTQDANNEWFLVAEKPLFEEMEKCCRFPNVAPYIIVGVVPGHYAMMYGEVNIPSFIWSAAYCPTRNISFGYLMDTNTLKYTYATIQDLQNKLYTLSREKVQLFDTNVSSNQELSDLNLHLRERKLKRTRYNSLTCDNRKPSFNYLKTRQTNS